MNRKIFHWLFLLFYFLPLAAGACAKHASIVQPVCPAHEEEPLLSHLPPELSQLEKIRKGYYFEVANQLQSKRSPLSLQPDLLVSGMLSFINGDLEKAEDFLSRAFEEESDKSRIGISYNSLFHLYLCQEKFFHASLLVNQAKKRGHEPSSFEKLVASVGPTLESMKIDWNGHHAEAPLLDTSLSCPVVAAVLNGQKREEFWLDSGSSINVVSSDLAEVLGIRPLCENSAMMNTATGGKVPFSLGILESLQIGDIRLKKLPVAIVNSSDLTFSAAGAIPPVQIRGILGWPSLCRFRTVLDFPARRLTLHRPPQGSSRCKRRNLFCFPAPFVRVVVNEKIPLNFFLDTGSRQSSLTPSGLAKMGFISETQASGTYSQGAGGGKAEKTEQVNLAAFTLDRTRVPALTLPVFPASGEFLAAPDGILGANILKDFVVTIDPFKGRIELTR